VRTASPSGLRHVEHCMGTVFSIDVRTPGADAAVIEEVVTWLHRVDRIFSTYRDTSDISRLGRGDIDIDDCAPEVREVLARCAELRDETDGYFDCRSDGVLDPSGYVKGWAIQRASGLLTAAGAGDHCVNGGGDVQCAGSAGPDRSWQVGIAHPLRPGTTIATVAGSDLAVATSGTAERGRHIIDPHSGERPDRFVGITVVGRRISDVDAYATAAFAMGDGAAAWLTAKGFSALLVRRDGTVVRTAAAARPVARA
jgi:thiamine biosynthesis lipoprotein